MEDQTEDLLMTEAKPGFLSRVKVNFFGAYSFLLAFSVVVLIITMGDAILSYVVPDFMQQHLDNSATLMGLVLSTSSMVGFAADFLFGKLFANKKFPFFIKWTFIFALAFPLTLILFPANPGYFIVAMAFWGIYYEMIGFANTQFIISNTPHNTHDFAWGLITIFRSISYTFGPLIAEQLLTRGENIPFYAAIGFFILGLVGFIIVDRSRKDRVHKLDSTDLQPTYKVEFKVWVILAKRLWALLLFIFVIILVDSAFWSVGAVLSQQSTDGSGGLLLFLYGLPQLFVGIIAGRVARPFGKKRAAFITMAISSGLLIIGGLSSDYNLLLVFVFLSSIFSSLTIPEIQGTFSDYDGRLNKTRNSLIGLESSFGNLAYIIGPIIAGVLSDAVGPQKTFGIMGFIALVVSIIAMIVVPRKLKMPRQDLAKWGMD